MRLDKLLLMLASLLIGAILGLSAFFIVYNRFTTPFEFDDGSGKLRNGHK